MKSLYRIDLEMINDVRHKFNSKNREYDQDVIDYYDSSYLKNSGNEIVNRVSDKISTLIDELETLREDTRVSWENYLDEFDDLETSLANNSGYQGVVKPLPDYKWDLEDVFAVDYEVGGNGHPTLIIDRKFIRRRFTPEYLLENGYYHLQYEYREVKNGTVMDFNYYTLNDEKKGLYSTYESGCGIAASAMMASVLTNHYVSIKDAAHIIHEYYGDGIKNIFYAKSTCGFDDATAVAAKFGITESKNTKVNSDNSEACYNDIAEKLESGNTCIIMRCAPDERHVTGHYSDGAHFVMAYGVETGSDGEKYLLVANSNGRVRTPENEFGPAKDIYCVSPDEEQKRELLNTKVKLDDVMKELTSYTDYSYNDVEVDGDGFQMIATAGSDGTVRTYRYNEDAKYENQELVGDISTSLGPN